MEAATQQDSDYLSLSFADLDEIPDEVFRMQRLKGLNLAGNNIRVVPTWLTAKLPKIRKLDLTGNPIEQLPDIPGLHLDWPAYLRCRGAISLQNVTGIRISLGRKQGEEHEIEGPEHVFGYLMELPNLRLLRITLDGVAYDLKLRFSAPQAGVDTLIERIGEFKGLNELAITGVLLEQVPDGIRALKDLHALTLYAAAIRELPSWISECSRLSRLQVGLNDLEDLPATVGDLSRLQFLGLADNRFSRIPTVVFSINALSNLDIACAFPSREGQITDIPAGVLNLSKLTSIRASGQPITIPPPEVVKDGIEAIKNYWRQQQEAGVDYLCEAKLLIVGEAGAGKTSLANKISDPAYKLNSDERSTEGIEVIRWKFPAAVRVKDQDRERVLTRDLHVNIWDFGGQEVYHATHQFFLTRRSLYALVADDRKEDTNFDYWLQVVELLSAGSPLVIVQNEKQGRRRDINIGSLRARFENLLGAYTVDLADNRGLEALVNVMRQQLEHLPHIGTPLPKTWKRVREALEKDPRNYIGIEEYFAICRQEGFQREEDMLQLSSYLHDLGVCLHFQGDPILRHIVILKPKWGTDAVYRVLDDDSVKQHRGRFNEDDLARIWSDEQYASMQQELLRLMMNFELCYQLAESGTYIAPQLLSPTQPLYEWNYPETLVLRYEYDFMPKGIITRLIVALNRRIANQNLVWKTGVILERNDTRAEAIEDYGRRKITVRVAGADTRGLLAVIDEELDRIHESFPRLKYDKFLPCICDECVGRDDAFAYSLATLKRAVQARKPIQCQKSFESVDAGALIRNIFPSLLQQMERPFGNLRDDLSSVREEVFVSYSWAQESNAAVDQIEKALREHDIRLIRDKNEIKYKDAIGIFMRDLGRGKAIVVVLSKAYLESKNCMFELTEIADSGNFRGRVFPIVLPDAKIYAPEDRLIYIGFWEQKIAHLKSGMQRVGSENLQGIREDLDLYVKIRNTLARIADILGDMNTLTLEEHRKSNFLELRRGLGSR